MYLYIFFHRLCKDLNLTVPGYPSKEKTELGKKKRKPPPEMECELCGLSLFDKFVLSVM